MLYILSQIAGWIATFLRAGGMLAKEPMTIKLLVSAGNLGWLISGILTAKCPASSQQWSMFNHHGGGTSKKW